MKEMNGNELADYIIRIIKNNPTEENLVNILTQVVVRDLDVRPFVKDIWVESGNICGFTAKPINTIFIGKHLYGKQYLNTFSHECRHVWQNKNNIFVPDNYINMDEDYQAYKSQQCEVDARAYSEKILDMFEYVVSYFMYNDDFLYMDFRDLIDTKWARATFVKYDTGEIVTREQAKQSFAMIYTGEKTFTCHIYK